MADVHWHEGRITRDDRSGTRTGAGCTVWLTGYSGSGKSTIARQVEEDLIGSGRAAYVLDGDNLRSGLNEDLGFSSEDRAENVRRVGEVALLLADCGVVAIAPLISPSQRARDAVASRHREMGVPFFLVHVSTPLEVCEQRDPKGLYAKARRGELSEFTGVSASYEAPNAPDLVVDSALATIQDASALIRGVLPSAG